MSIEKRANGYSVRWRDHSGKQNSQQVSLYRDAVVMDADIKRRRVMGDLILHEQGRMPLRDFWEMYLERYGRVNLATVTLTNYEVMWKKHIAPNLGHKQIRHIMPDDVSRLIATLNKTLSSGSIHKVLAVLGGVLSRAVEWGYIAHNAVSKVKKPKMRSRRGRALTTEQVDAICLELDARSQAVVRMLAYTGMRPGELRALEWEDIGATLSVTKAISDDRMGPTKTGGSREVLMRPEIQTVLTAWALKSGKRTGYVFGGRPGKFWSDSGWKNWQRKTFVPAAKRAGIEGVVPYDLRHTFVSTLIAEGRDIYWIARQAGHNPTMTLSTYGHLFEDSYGGPIEDVSGTRRRRGF